MKRKMFAKLFKLGIIFSSVYTCLFGFIINANTVYAIDARDSDEFRIVSKEEYLRDITDDEHKVFVDNPYTIEGNSIRVGSIYNHLMNDTGDFYYLDRNIDGVYDGLGVPFVDFRNDFTGRKTIIYAHSATNGNGPFNGLQNYHNNPDYYKDNKYITIEYNGYTYTYEIFSVYVSLADNEESEGLEYYYNMDYTDQEWANTIQSYKNHSEYDTGVSVSGSDKIVILQTCSMDPQYFDKYYRYNLLVMGKLI